MDIHLTAARDELRSAGSVSHRPIVVAVVLSLLCFGIGGCGGSSGPDGKPRDAVLALLDAMQKGDYTKACSKLSPRAIAELRLVTIGPALRVPAESSSERLAFLRHVEETTQRCPAMLALRSAQLRPRLTQMRVQAASQALAKPFPANVWTIGPNQEWTIELQRDTWIVTGVDPLM